MSIENRVNHEFRLYMQSNKQATKAFKIAYDVKQLHRIILEKNCILKKNMQAKYAFKYFSERNFSVIK